MKTHYSFMVLIFAVVVVGGCRFPIRPESAIFRHEDELVRKDNFAVLADRRIFATMAYLNTVGFDEECEGKQMYPARLAVRKMLKDTAAAHPEKLKAWKQYHRKTGCARFHYKDFALSLSTDYPFKRIRPYNELGYFITFFKLADFPSVLNDFWQTAEMDKIWAQVKPLYLEDIHKYDFERMEQQFNFLWSYLRMQRTDELELMVIPNPLDMRFTGTWSLYENYGYIVESPRTYGLNLHEYLHSISDSFVRKHYSRHRRKLNKYYQAAKDLPYASSYQHPVTHACESLVRAMDIRMHALMNDDPETIKMCEARCIELSESGLSLVHPFYELLKQYEQTDMSFDQFVPQMLDLVPELAPGA